MLLFMADDSMPNLEFTSDGQPDLDEIDACLDAVEIALVRLENGTYFTDEVTGKPLDERLLISNPIARRA
jgi:RNA polymerase-binding transcription factor DksA